MVRVVCSVIFIRTNCKAMLTFSSLQFTSFSKCSYSLVLAGVNSVFCMVACMEQCFGL